MSNTALELAKKGGVKLLEAVKKFILDSRIVNEINDRADVELFLPAASGNEYQCIEDIKENDIYDKFIEWCLTNYTLGVKTKSFVEEYYKWKSEREKEYIECFFEQLRNIIFEVLCKYTDSNTKIILRGQEILFDKIKQLIDQHNKDNPTTAVIYCANMQNTKWSIGDYNSALENQYVEREIDLSLKNSIIQPRNGLVFWETEREALSVNFAKKIEPLLDENKTFSVFALAPIPLLLFLGYKFANHSNVAIYQLQKNSNSWQWAKSATPLNIKVNWHRNLDLSNEAVVILSFSDKVNLKNVSKIIDINHVPTVELSIEEPFDDFLHTKQQLDEFMDSFRILKSKLRTAEVTKIHLFAAIPNSFALSIGKAYNPNYDINLVTYDYCKGEYSKALVIGEER